MLCYMHPAYVAHVPRQSLAEEQHVQDAVKRRFRSFLLNASPASVAPLLQVLNGAARIRFQRPHRFQLWYKTRSTQAPIVQLLRVFVHAWQCEQMSALAEWRVAHFLMVAEAFIDSVRRVLSHASSIRERAEAVRAICSTVDVVQDTSGAARTLAFAISVGVLSGCFASDEASIILDKEYAPLMERVQSCVIEAELLFGDCANRTAWTTPDAHQALAIVLLAARASDVLCKVDSQPRAQIAQLLQGTLEAALANWDGTDIPNKHSSDDRNQMDAEAQTCIKRYASVMGRAFGLVETITKSQRAAIGLLQEVATRSAKNPFVRDFACAALPALCRTPEEGAIGVDLLGVLSNHHAYQEIAVARRTLQPLVASGMQSVGILARIAISLLCDERVPDRRLVFVLQSVTEALRAFEKRSVSLHENCVSARNIDSEEPWTGLSEVLLTAMRTSSSRSARGTRYQQAPFRAVLDVALAMITSSTIFTIGLRGELAQSVMKMLLTNSVLDMPTGKRLALVVDAVVSTGFEMSRITACMQTLASEIRARAKGERRIAIALLMRCLTSCELRVLAHVLQEALQIAHSFDDTIRQELEAIARYAVLGSDAVRKSACVSWLLDVFDRDIVEKNTSTPRLPMARL